MLSLFVNSSSRHLFGSISVQGKVSPIILISFRWDYLWHWIRTTFEKEVFRAIHRADRAHSEVLVLNFHAHLQQAKVTSEMKHLKLSSQCWRKRDGKRILTVDNSDMRRTWTIWVKFENSKTSFPYLPRSPPPWLPPTATPPPPQDHLAWSEWVSRGVNPRLRAGPGTRRDLTFV